MKFIIFDIDGTLTNTKAIDDRCFICSFYNVFKVDISNEDWSKIKHVTDWGITDEIVRRELDRNVTQVDLDNMLEEHVRLLTEAKLTDPNQFDIVAHADDFIAHLFSQDDIKVGIATGAWERSAELKLSPFDIDLDKMAFSNSNNFISRSKITKDVINQLSSRYGQPDEVIYFGDGEWDYKTCQHLGIRFIGIDCNEDGKLKALGVQDVFVDYSEQETILQKLI